MGVFPKTASPTLKRVESEESTTVPERSYSGVAARKGEGEVGGISERWIEANLGSLEGEREGDRREEGKVELELELTRKFPHQAWNEVHQLEPFRSNGQMDKRAFLLMKQRKKRRSSPSRIERNESDLDQEFALPWSWNRNGGREAKNVLRVTSSDLLPRGLGGGDGEGHGWVKGDGDGSEGARREGRR